MTRPCPACAFLAVLSLPLWLAFASLAADETSSELQRDSTGWIDLLAEAGPGLTGWTRGSIPPDKPLTIQSQWSLDPKSNTLLCQGDGGHEWLRWDKELADFIYHVEWRFIPVDGKKGYNSGVYVRNSADATIWHQAQTGDASGGFLFGDTPVEGKITRVNLSKATTAQRVRPAGEWNNYEITCKGKEVTLWVNGAVTCEWHDFHVPKGYVGLEAEGWRIEFRNVKVKPL